MTLIDFTPGSGAKLLGVLLSNGRGIGVARSQAHVKWITDNLVNWVKQKRLVTISQLAKLHHHNTIITTPSTQHHPHNTIHTTSSTHHHQQHTINTTPSIQHITTPSTQQHHQPTVTYTAPQAQQHLRRSTWNTSGSFCAAGAALGAPS